MFCKKCGAKININEKFCSICGNRIEPIQFNEDSTKSQNYEENLKKLAEKEIELDGVKMLIMIVFAIIMLVYYMTQGFGFVESSISGVVCSWIIVSIIGSPILKSVKKDKKCFKANEKYEKFKELKSTMDINMAIQSVELEYSNIYQSKGHGLLYYLICIVVIIFILPSGFKTSLGSVS